MNITLKRTDEQVELVKAMASRDRTVAYEAQAALAEFMGPVLAEVVNQAPVVSNLFSSFSFELALASLTLNELDSQHFIEPFAFDVVFMILGRNDTGVFFSLVIFPV